jgi:secreted trypsin-like serine protease
MSRCLLLAVALVAAAPLARAETSGAPVPQPGPTEEPIIGGTAVPAGKWPDAVAVLGTTGACTGTLIAPDVVLTAGHCAEIKPTRVVANTLDYGAPGGTSAAVKSTTPHADWQNSYDVSVIVLASPIAGVSPRKLGTACTFQGFAASTQVHLVGFGSTDVAGGGTNTSLQEVMAPVTDPDCTKGSGCVAAVAPGGEFVVGGDGKDTCFGDSGGPVYLDTPRGPVVVGAVSRGIDGAATPCGGGGIYVRTDKIASWIETTAGKQIAKDTCSGSGRADDGGAEADVTGGCSAGGGAGGLAPLGLCLLLLPLRRRAQTV